MNSKLRSRGPYLSLASVLTVGAAAAGAHCSTTEINVTPDAGGSGSSSGSSSSGSSSSSSGSSSSSSSGGTLVCPPPGAATILPDGGAALIPPSNAHTAGTAVNDAGLPYNVQWGTFSPFGAGTYWYPADTTGAPAAPGSIADVISDSGATCTTLGSQNTFATTYSLATNSWHLTGTIGTYSGVGFYLVPCFDATTFSGVTFTVQGDVGDETAGDGGDAGPTGGVMTFGAVQASNNLVNTTGTAGTCPATCNPATMNFPVTSTPRTFTVHWTDLMGGAPEAMLDMPAQIVRIQWQYVWPCTTNPTPFNTDVTISNIQLVQ